jgi:predicted chitinase
VSYLQAAIQEFKVSDKRLAAAIIATIAVETPRFEAYEESVEQGQKYENMQSLGNKQPGDGVRYRGRGYLRITGRSNYAQMSLRLGLGTRLLDSPDDAKSPEVASRILVAWFVDRQNKLSAALAAGDLTAARRVVSGGVNQLERFTAAYNKILAQL